MDNQKNKIEKNLKRKPITIMIDADLYQRIRISAMMEEKPIYKYLEECLEVAVQESEAKYAKKIIKDEEEKSTDN